MDLKEGENSKHKVERESEELKIWENIDNLFSNDKTQLNKQIEDGMEKKKELTSANKQLKEKHNKRSDLERKLQTY
jgi:hypothetical protein